MSSVYECLKANRGFLAFYIYTHDLDLYLPFGLKYNKLRQAIITAQDQCISTSIVDELLKSDTEIIDSFINALNETEQQHVIKYFNTIASGDGDNFLYAYTHAIECGVPVPQSYKAKLQTNYDTICTHYNLNKAKNLLIDNKVISHNCYHKISKYINENNEKKAIMYLIDILMNGNKEQYSRFLLVTKQKQPELLYLFE